MWFSANTQCCRMVTEKSVVICSHTKVWLARPPIQCFMSRLWQSTMQRLEGAGRQRCLEVQQKWKQDLFVDNKHVSMKTGIGESQVGNECGDDFAIESFESNDKVVCGQM